MSEKPTKTPSSERDGELGGIPQTTDSPLRDAGEVDSRSPAGAPQQQVPTQPSGSSGAPGKPAARSAGDAKRRADIRADEAEPDTESPAESLGRAIGAPLSGEAAPKEPRR